MKKNFIFTIFLMLVFANISFAMAIGAFVAPDLIVNNPIDSVYNSRTILFDLETDQKSDFFVTKYIHRPAGWKLLCKNTMECSEESYFKEGDNRVLIKAVNSAGETITDVISFSIDTKIPKIHMTEPRRNTFTNGELFSVKYTEEHVEDVTLFYGNDDFVSRDDCDSGRNEACEFEDVDLSSYDGQEIDYWFQITDIAGNIETSKKTKINIDTTAPKVHFYEYEIERTRVDFVFEIEEQNFDKIEYIDNSEKIPKWKTLCSKFRNGRCDVQKSFKKGTHNLDIKVVDKAGNSGIVVEDEEFEI